MVAEEGWESFYLENWESDSQVSRYSLAPRIRAVALTRLREEVPPLG
jgi:hypothetical protein